jgi:hypothetical protein
MEFEESVLMMSFNFSVMNPHSNLDIVCAVDSVLKLPQTLGMECRWRIRSMLEKSKSSILNLTKKELKAVKSLRLNRDIRTQQADKGNCTVVLDESKYNDKLNTLL